LGLLATPINCARIIKTTIIIATTDIFYPVVIETAGTWHHKAVELTHEIGRRATNITGDYMSVPAVVLALKIEKFALLWKETAFPRKMRFLPKARSPPPRPW